MSGFLGVVEDARSGASQSSSWVHPTASGSGGSVRRRVLEIEAAQMLELVEATTTTRRKTHRTSSTTKVAQTSTRRRATTTTTTMTHHSRSNSNDDRTERRRTSSASTKRHTTRTSTARLDAPSHSTRRSTSAAHSSHASTHHSSSTKQRTRSTSGSDASTSTHHTTTRSSTSSRPLASWISSTAHSTQVASDSQSSTSSTGQASTVVLQSPSSTTSSAILISQSPASAAAASTASSTSGAADSATSPVTSTTAPLLVTNTSSQRMSKGDIAGTTIGSLLAAALLLLLGFCLLARRKRHRKGDSGIWGSVPSSSYEYERDMRQTGSVLWGAPGAMFSGAGQGTARSHSSFIAGPRWSAQDEELDPLTAPGNMSPVDREFPQSPASTQDTRSAPFAAYAPGGYGTERARSTPPTTPTDWAGRAATHAGLATPPAALASPHRASRVVPAGLLTALFGHDGARAGTEELQRAGQQEDTSNEGPDAGLTRTQTNGSWDAAAGATSALAGLNKPGGWSFYGTPRQYAPVSHDSPTLGRDADYMTTQPLNWNRKPSTPQPTPTLSTADEQQEGTLDTHREAWLWASADNRVSEMGLVRTNAKRGSLVDRRSNTVRSARSGNSAGSVYSDGTGGSLPSQGSSTRGGTPNTSELFYTTPHWIGTKVGEAKPISPARRKVRLPSLPSTSSDPFVSQLARPPYPVVLPPSPPQSFESGKRSDTPGGGTIDRIAASFAGALIGLGRPLGSSRNASDQEESLLGFGPGETEVPGQPSLAHRRLAKRPGTPPAGLALDGPARAGNRSPHGGMILPAMLPMASPGSSHRSMSGLGHGQYRTPWTRAGEGSGEGWTGIAARQGPVSPPRPPKSELRKGKQPASHHLNASSSASAVETPPLSSPEQAPLASPLFPDYNSYFARTAPRGGSPTEQPFVPPGPGQASDQHHLDQTDASSGRAGVTSPPPALPLPPPPAPGKRWTIRRGTLGGDSEEGSPAPPPMWQTHAGVSSSDGSRNNSVSSEGWQTDGSSAGVSWVSGGQGGDDDLGWEEVDVGVPVRRG